MEALVLDWDGCTPKCALHIIQDSRYEVYNNPIPPVRIERKEGKFVAYLCNPEITNKTRCVSLVKE